MNFSSAVPAAFTDWPLTRYLAHRFTYLSAADWDAQLAKGRIFINDEPCLGNVSVRGGDIVLFTFAPQDFPEPPADLAYQVVFEDQWLLAINKPGNLLVHRQGRSLTHNLLYQLRHVHQPPYPLAGVVNRLDRETSGLVLVAKHPDFLGRLNALFAERRVAKTYLAVVNGRPQPDEGEIDAPIGQDPESVISYRYCVGAQAIRPKPARTRYRVIADYGRVSLLRLQPETGRTHQLRVHLQHIGHPIMGDKLYGRTDEEFLRWRQRPMAGEAAEAMARQALHAEGLCFIHPWTGEEVVLAAAMPEDMTRWLVRDEGAALSSQMTTG